MNRVVLARCERLNLKRVIKVEELYFVMEVSETASKVRILGTGVPLCPPLGLKLFIVGIKYVSSNKV